jgi:hypothetical protein
MVDVLCVLGSNGVKELFGKGYATFKTEREGLVEARARFFVDFFAGAKELAAFPQSYSGG